MRVAVVIWEVRRLRCGGGGRLLRSIGGEGGKGVDESDGKVNL